MLRLLLAACMLLVACVHSHSVTPRVPIEDWSAGVVKISSNSGRGTGFAWDESTIVTAAHVVQHGVRYVYTHENKSCEVVSVTLFPGADLAAVTVDGCRLSPLAHSPVTPEVGSEVYVLGHPMGYDYTLTRGIVSARNRASYFEKLYQIDAPINPGNSGGPVLDSHGRVVGVAVAIATVDGMWAGIGLVVPAEVLSEKLSVIGK